MPKTCETGHRGPAMRWFCGVPVLANPLILIDLGSAVVVMWFVTVLLVVGAQALLGDGPLLGSHIAAACSYAGYVALLLPALYFAVCLLFFRKGYVILYRLEDNGLFMETLRAPSLSGGGIFQTRPFPASESFDPVRSVTKNVDWGDVKSIRELESIHTLQLRGRFGTLATVYCPDRACYAQALQTIRKKANLP